MDMRCGKSHDLDMILDAEEQRDSRRRKKRKINGSKNSQGAEGGEENTNPENGVSNNSAVKAEDTSLVTPGISEQSALVVPIATTAQTENVLQPGEKFHSAYFDAYMTGTVFSHQMNQHQPDSIELQAKNKVYLIGKSIPLIVEKSAFGKYSPEHERLRSL
jgi:target of EGR1 protein 1